MIADILAMQDLYDDLDSAYNAGDTVYGVNSNFTGYLAEYFELLTAEITTDFFSGITINNDNQYPTRKLTFSDFDNDNDLDLVIGEGGISNLIYFENTGNNDNPVYTEKSGTENPFTGLKEKGYAAPFAIDLNNDNLIDLVFSENNGPSDQQITFLKNVGTATDPKFEKQIDSLNPFNGIETDSWSTVSLADLDNDDKPDLVTIRGGTPVYYRNTGTNDTPAFTEITGDDNPFKSITAARFNTPFPVDVNNDGLIDMVAGSTNGNISTSKTPAPQKHLNSRNNTMTTTPSKA